MSYWAGTLLASPIVRGSSGDTYGTHHSILGVGGYMEVATVTDRNSLPVDTVNGIGYDGVSSGQRRMGMLVYVYEDDTIYQLYVEKTTWDSLTSLGKLTALGNNSNWKVFVTGEQSSTSEHLTKEFEQPTHGFDVGDVIAHDGSEFFKIDNFNAATYEPIGLISNVVDSNNFRVTLSGYISTSSILDVDSNILSGGTIYYLSDVAGKLTAVKPTGSTNVNKPMLVTMSANTGVVLQYRGIYDNIGTLSYDLFSGYTATTQQFLDKTVTGGTNLGYFTGYTGIQKLPLTYLTSSSFNGDYASLYNNYYRDDEGYVRIGIAPDGIPRRGYLRTTEPAISWIWNEYTGDGAPVGWVFLYGDISDPDVYGSSGLTSSYSFPAYTASTWTTGQAYNNGSDIIVSSVEGSNYTGTTYLIGGPVYSDKENQELRFRTIVTESPDVLSVKYDDYFIKLSGITSVSEAVNVGSGTTIFSGMSGTTLLMKTILGDGDTTVTDNGTTITISSSGGGSSSGASGENVTKRITQTSHGFTKGNVVGWSGGTYNKAIADGTYNGEIIGVVSTVVNSNTFDVTQSGYISGMTGLVQNATYFVAGDTFGGITTTAPTTDGYLVRPIMVANSTSTAWVLPYPGYIITSPITGGTGGGGDQTYTGASPSNVTVGALVAGSVLTGRSITSILQEMLITTYYPTYTAPSASFTEDAASIYEVGCVTDVNFTAGFNRGQITLSGSFQNYRSGDVNCYYYTGTGLPASVASTSLSDNQTASGVVVPYGTCSWTSCVGYDEGPQPLDSDGCDYQTPLAAGTTGAISRSLTGIYPYYWGTVASGGVPAGSNRPTANNALVVSGTKVVSSSNSTITISFGATADDYLWFAIPSDNTSKTCWYVDALNNGNIGGSVNPGGNLFPDFDTVSVTSAEACWGGVNYKVYISNYQSLTSGSMQLRNS